MTYIIKDWAGNVMDWGVFDTDELAYVALTDHCEDICREEGLDDSLYDVMDDYAIVEIIT